MTRRVSSPQLIGREVELRDASIDLDLAAGGRVAVILLGGEAGIGKTRLAGAITALATARGFRAVRGGCVPVAMTPLPYGPFTQAFAELALDLEPEVLADIVAGDGPLLSRIASALAGLPGGASDPTFGASRARLIEAVAATLRRLAARAPVLVIIEDLHWADPESLDVLSYLVRSSAGTRMAILLSFRSDEIATHARLEPWLGQVGRTVPVDRIELRRLTRDETALLIEAIRGSRPTVRLADSVHERSNGNPFLIEELLQAGADRSPDDGLPAVLGEVLGDRIDHAPARVWPLLRSLAVAGCPVDDELLATVAGMPERKLAEALHQAVSSGLVVVEHRGARDRVHFRHELMREVAYDRLLASERRSLHAAFGRALEARGGDGTARDPGHWAALARHWSAAGDLDRALPAAIRAAKEAERTFAFTAALDQYERALQAWAAVDAAADVAGCERLDLLRWAANAAFLAGAGATDLALRREAVLEADGVGDPERQAMTRAELGHTLWACGEAAESEAVFRAAVALLPAEPPSVGRSRALSVLSQLLMNTGRHRECIGFCEEALALARQLGDRDIEGHASNTIGVAMGYLGRCSEAVDMLERSRSIAVQLDDPNGVGRGYLNETEILTICGQRRRALELVDEGVAVCRHMGVHVSYGEGISLHGCTAAFEVGDWAAAERYAREWTCDLDSANDELYRLAHTVELGVARGTWTEVDPQLVRMTDLLAGYPVELQYTAPWAAARAELALWRGDPAGALEAVRDGLSRLERTDDVLFRSRLLRLGVRAAADLAETGRALGDARREGDAIHEAAQLRRRVAPVMDRAGSMHGGLACEVEVALVEVDAEVSRLCGTPEPDQWRRTADGWARLERPYPVAYARWREAEAHLRRHDRVAARQALAMAADGATALGAAPLASQIAALGRHSGITRLRRRAIEPAIEPASTAPSPDTHGLTPRELEVLELLGRGLTDRQIGDTLFISRYTASIHVSRILAKLGVSSRTEAAGNAYRLGIIPIAGDAAAPREIASRDRPE